MEYGWRKHAWKARQMVGSEIDLLELSRPLPSLVRVREKMVFSQPYDGYDSFNMSVLGDICSFRSSNFRPKSNASGKHSFISTGKIDNDRIFDMKKLEHRGFNVPLWDRYNGMEDPKLIVWRDELWCLFARPNHSITRIGMRMISLNTGKSYSIQDPLSRDFSKNWMPVVIGNKLLLVTDVDPLMVYEFENGTMIPVHMEHRKKNNFLVHGGSNIISIGGNFIGIVHGRFEFERGRWFYWHAIANFQQNFNDVVIGRPFYFEDRQIEFCLSIDKRDNNLVVPYSVDDATLSMLKFDLESLEVLM